MRLNAVSMPSFIWRPSSRAEPEKGATMPKRISLLLMPRTLLAGSGTACVMVGVAVAIVAGGAATGGAGGAGGAAGAASAVDAAGAIGAAGAAGAGAGAGAATAADGPITPAS